MACLLPNRTLVLVAILWLASIQFGLASETSTQGTGQSKLKLRQTARLRPVRVRPIRVRLPKPPNFHFKPIKGFVPPAPTPPPITGAVNVKDYGATGNGVTDDQTAITNAVTAAAARGAAVYFPTGYYVHSGTIYSSAPFFGDGSGSELVGSNQLSYAVYLQGNGVSISKMAVGGEIAVQGTNFLIDQITLLSSPNNGIEVMNSSTGKISNSQIYSALNAGVYIWNSNNIQLVNSTVNTADLQYFRSNEYAVRIDAQGNQQIANQYINIGGNSISGRVLLHNCQAMTFSNNNVVYGNLDVQLIGYTADGNPGTFISNNTINGVNLNTSGAATGLAINFATSPTSNYVSVSGNNVSDFLVGLSINGPTVADVSRNTFSNILGPGISAVSSPFYANEDLYFASNNFQYISGEGIQVTCAGGAIEIDSNQFTYICGQTPGAVIDASYSGGTNYMIIRNNAFAAPAQLAQYFISCTVPGSASNPSIYGNNSGALIPNNLAP